MATFSGNSIDGLQLLATYTPSATRWITLDLPAFDPQDYKQRIGLVLVRQGGAAAFPRVVDIRKLFATGLLFIPAFPLPGATYAIAVDWYRVGTPWVLNTAP